MILKKTEFEFASISKKWLGFWLGIEEKMWYSYDTLFLLPEYRGFGLGRKLMDMFMDYMKEQGVNKAFLLTTHEHEAAISLYTRYGFCLTEEKESQEYGKFLIIRRYDLEKAYN